MAEGAHPLVAIVDIGTNSVLMLVVRPLADGHLERRHEACVITRLGQGIDRSGALAEVAVNRTLAALETMSAQLDQLGVSRRAAIATAVLRRVRDGETFTRPAEAVLGCPIEIVSGHREAQLVCRGVLGAFGSQPAGTLIFDVGGGSTELILLQDARGDAGGQPSIELASLDVGAVRLTERLVVSDPPSDGELDAVREAVAGALAPLPAAFAARPASAPVVGVAGTVTTLATVQLVLAKYDTEKVNGSILRRAQVRDQIARYASVGLEQRRSIVGLEPERADVITAGAVIVDSVLQRFGAERMWVCDRGVRWGLARELASASLDRGPP